MRKVEQKMINAIVAMENMAMYWRRDDQCYNTEVVQHFTKGAVMPAFAEVKLFGNTIAKWHYGTGKLVIDDCGYQTVTTKARLNVILAEFNKRHFTGAPVQTGEGYPWTLGIYQKAHEWYLVVPGQPDLDWQGQATIQVERNKWAGWRVTHTDTTPQRAAV